MEAANRLARTGSPTHPYATASGEGERVRLALLAGSPMYYQAPLYRRLAEHPACDFTAIFASSGGPRPHDAGYGRPITWDVDSLGGYRSVFLKKAATNPIDGSFFSFTDFDIVRTLRRGRYDVLWMHGYNSVTHLLAALTQRAAGRGLALREEQTLLHPRGRAKSLAKDFGLPRLFSKAAGMYIGSENRRWFEHYGFDADRLFFTPYCVDNERFRSAAEALAAERDALRARFGIAPEAGPVIVSVSRLIEKKQPLFLLDAFRRARAESRCALLVVGAGELENQMRSFVQQYDVPDVHFAGFLNQSQVSDAYAAADIFALLSRKHETWGLVVNEAMNFGLPLVVSDKVGCATDLVRERDTGFVVSHGDPADAAAALRRLVDSPELRAELGGNARKLIPGWNYDVVAEGIVAAAHHAARHRLRA